MRSTVAARLDRLPITSFHRRLALAIGAGLFVVGFDVYLGSGVYGARSINTSPACIRWRSSRPLPPSDWPWGD